MRSRLWIWVGLLNAVILWVNAQFIHFLGMRQFNVFVMSMSATITVISLPAIAVQSYEWSMRGKRGRKGNVCQNCGYDLTGNISGVCPECGGPIVVARQDVARMNVFKKGPNVDGLAIVLSSVVGLVGLVIAIQGSILGMLLAASGSTAAICIAFERRKAPPKKPR